MSEKNIYLDNAATTKLKKEVLNYMMPYFTEKYGNPSSIYSFAKESRAGIKWAREKIAQIIGSKEDEIFFTASGTEADNFAIKGVMRNVFRKTKGKKNKIITSSIEHHAVLHTCEYLEKEGFVVEYIDVDKNGIINLDKLKDSIDDHTALITVMYANNEIGTIQPIKEIGKIAKENKVLFHTDAVQAMGALTIDVKELNIDLLSMSAHKFNGPKGVGALYIKKGTLIDPLLHGGAQEKKKRSGTENIPGIVGMAKALELSHVNLDEKNDKITKLRDYAIKRIEEEFKNVRLNGHTTKRLPNNINFSFEFIEGEALLLMLDFYGISASSGSACTSGSLDPSHVLLAIGLSHEIAHGSLRLTLSEDNSKEEIDYTIDKLKIIVQKLRDMSPLYKG